jgi:hypothetical protein
MGFVHTVEYSLRAVGLAVRSLVVDEGEVAFLLLGEVQREHGVQAVHDWAQVSQVLRGWLAGADCDDEPPEQMDLVVDRGVGAAHRQGRVVPAEDPADRGVEQGVLRGLVRQQDLH